jgi:hypothetical protein
LGLVELDVPPLEVPALDVLVVDEPPELEEQALGSHSRMFIEPPASSMQDGTQWLGEQAAGQLAAMLHVPQPVGPPLLVQNDPATSPCAQAGYGTSAHAAVEKPSATTANVTEIFMVSLPDERMLEDEDS